MHAFCGAWGLVAAGLFADPDLLEAAGYHLDDHVYGLFVGGNGKLLLAALVGILVVSLWVLGQMVRTKTHRVSITLLVFCSFHSSM